jgi:hypothetical protein
MNLQLELRVEYFFTNIASKNFDIFSFIVKEKFKSERYVKMHIYNTHNKRNGKALTSKVESGVCDICGKWFSIRRIPLLSCKLDTV